MRVEALGAHNLEELVLHAVLGEANIGRSLIGSQETAVVCLQVRISV